MNTITRSIYKKIPGKYKFALLNIYKAIFNRKGGVYYGQRAEDIILKSLLTNKKGFYVDIGSYHPFMYNNTYVFYKKGWNGINVDANPITIKSFQKHRKRDINLNLAVGDESKKLTYYNFSEPAYSTTVKEEYERVIRDGDSEFIEAIEIECKPLSEIFKEHLPDNQEIDLLDIDVQGNDFEVLKSNDWSKYLPRIIIIESLDFDINSPQEEEIYQFLIPKGYELYAYDQLNLIFRRKPDLK